MAPPRKSPDEKLAELHQKKARLEAQIHSERARLRQAERKRDTRRKIIAGAVVLEHASQNPQFQTHLNSLLRRFVTRPQDLELFELTTPAAPGDQISNDQGGPAIENQARQQVGIEDQAGGVTPQIAPGEFRSAYDGAN